jgi:hypothetical protein
MRARRLFLLLPGLAALLVISVPAWQVTGSARAQRPAPPAASAASRTASVPALDPREFSRSLVALYNVSALKYPDAPTPDMKLFTPNSWRDFMSSLQGAVRDIRADAAEHDAKPGKIVTQAAGAPTATIGRDTASVQIPVQQTIGNEPTQAKTISVVLIDLPHQGWRIQSLVLF